MALGAAAAWLCALGATGDLLLDASMGARVGARRGSYPAGVGDAISGVRQQAVSTSGELALLPDVALTRDGRVDVSLRYRPRLLVPVDLSSGAPELRDLDVLRRRVTVTHDARLAVDARRETWTLKSSLEGVYAEADLRNPAEVDGQVIVTTVRLPYAFARARASFEAAPSRRTSYAFGGAAFMAGGAGEAARSAVPLQRVLQLDAALRWNMTRRDILSAWTFATGSHVDGGEDTTYALVGPGWERLVPAALTVKGAAGVAATFGRTIGAMPWFEASLAHKPEAPRPSAELRLAASPGIDRVTGAIDMTSSAQASVTWPRTPRWSFQARASATALGGWSGVRSFGDPDTLFVWGELRVNRQLRPLVTESLYVRTTAQHSDRPNVEEFREVGIFVEIVAHRISRL